MANKKVSQLTSKPSVLVTDLFPIADPSTGQLYKTTISDLGTAIGSGVSSVNGLVGAVVLDTDDIQELVSPTNKWFTDTRARAALSASSPLAYNSGTGVFSIPAATSSQNGYLTSTDWATFNSKQAALSGTGFVKISGTTISYDNSTYTVNGGFIAGQLIFAQNTTSLAGSTSLSWDNTNGYLKLGLAIVSTAKLQVGGNAEASSFIKTGGTSSQFLKADGSIDSSIYLTTSAASSTYIPLSGGTLTGALSGTSSEFSGLNNFRQTDAGVFVKLGGNLTKANIYQFTSGGLAGAVFNIGHNFYYDGTAYGQDNTSKSGWVISSNLNADTFTIARAAAGSTSAPTSALSFASTGAATFSSSVTATSFTAGSSSTSSDVLINLSADTGAFAIKNVRASHSFSIYDHQAGVDRFWINSSGFVGIGTTAPTTKFHLVNGVVTLEGTGNATRIEINDTSGANLTLNPALSGSGTPAIQVQTNHPLLFATNNTERLRITNGGGLSVKSQDSGLAFQVYTNLSSSITAINIGGAGSINGIANGWNASAHILSVARDTGSLRSINAAGSVNAMGLDYAEYMVKSITETIEKGDLVGINSIGNLTNKFADSISFAIKSTNPSFIGGDNWGSNIEDKQVLEQERQKVDRVAFSGQVPCNVLNAKVGDYIIPVNDNGKIKGIAVSNPTFEQYQISVGKVWKIMEDGRAWVAVKIG